MLTDSVGLLLLLKLAILKPVGGWHSSQVSGRGGAPDLSPGKQQTCNPRATAMLWGSVPRYCTPSRLLTFSGGTPTEGSESAVKSMGCRFSRLPSCAEEEGRATQSRRWDAQVGRTRRQHTCLLLQLHRHDSSDRTVSVSKVSSRPGHVGVEGVGVSGRTCDGAAVVGVPLVDGAAVAVVGVPPLDGAAVVGVSLLDGAAVVGAPPLDGAAVVGVPLADGAAVGVAGPGPKQMSSRANWSFDSPSRLFPPVPWAVMVTAAMPVKSAAGSVTRVGPAATSLVMVTVYVLPWLVSELGSRPPRRPFSPLSNGAATPAAVITNAVGGDAMGAPVCETVECRRHAGGARHVRSAPPALTGVKVTTWLVATSGAMDRLFTVNVLRVSTLFSSGAMVGTPLTPTRLKMASVGLSTTLCRQRHRRLSGRS